MLLYHHRLLSEGCAARHKREQARAACSALSREVSGPQGCLTRTQARDQSPQVGGSSGTIAGFFLISSLSLGPLHT